MTRPVKVCCLCERWESGGIESFLDNVLSRLDMERFQVDVVASSLGESVFTDGLRRSGVHFYELSGDQRRTIGNSRRFMRLLRERRYDVVHLNAFHGLSLRYLWLAERAGVPVRIAHSHNTALRPSLGRPLKLLLHRLARRAFAGSATAFWACSSAAAGFLFPKGALGRRGYTFIPNAIDTYRFAFRPALRDELRKDLGLTGAYVIGNTGRLCAQKNQGFLLEAFAQVLPRVPESRLLLVGEGELRPRLERLAEGLGIREKVVFFGVTDRIEQLLWAMDAFAFPSRFEGLGIAAVEAQAAGLPVVASEAVPQEARIAGTFRTVPLARGPQGWAEALLACRPPAPARTEAAAAVRRAGFHILDAVSIVEGHYRNTEGESVCRTI